jgi:hypothetical protein
MARSIRLATLFVEFESNAKGFRRDLQDNQRALGRLTEFVQKNTLVAIGALGAAAAAAALKAAQMAAAFDASARKIAAVVPGATARLEDLKKVANDLATSKGLSSEAVLGGLNAVARQGVADLEHLKARFETVQKTADATGASFDEVAAGLDQALDVFGLADADLEKVAARLASVSEGKFPIEDLFGALQASARTAKDAGISFDAVVGRLSVLVAEGKNAKQSAAQLKEELDKGRASFDKLPKAIGNTADQIARLNERAATAAGSVERMQAQVSERFLERVRASGSAINTYFITPIERLILLLTDPLLTGDGLGRALAGALALANGDVRSALEIAKRRPATTSVPAPLSTSGPGHGFAGSTGGPNFGRDANGDLVLSGTGLSGPAAIDSALVAKAAQFSEEVRDALVKASDTLVDDMALALGELENKYREVSAALTADQRRLFEEQFAQLQKDLATQIKAESITQGLTPTLGTTSERGSLKLKGDADALEDATKGAADQAERYKRAQIDADRGVQQSRDHVRQQADAIQRAVRDAVQLGEAFGVLDENVGKALEGIGQVASELSVVAKNGLSFSSVLTIGAGVASVLGGLLGESADAKRDREIREQNTEAIHELTKALTTQTSGQQAGTARQAVGALLAAGVSGVGRGKFSAGFDPDAVAALLRPFGLTLKELEDILKDINPDLQLNTSSSRDFINTLRQMQQALDELNFRAFAESFAGQLQMLNDQFQLFDITDPIEQLKQLEALGEKSSPFIKSLLEGLDLTTQAGREEAARRIAEAYSRLGKDTKNGGLTADELGKLSSEELRQYLLDLDRRVKEIDNGSQSGGGGATTFGAIAGVTEVTGNRLAGILTSADIHLAGIEAGVTDIRNLLAPLVLVPPPALGDAFSPAGGPIVIEVNVYGAPDQATAKAIGGTVGDHAADAIDRRLGERARKRAIQGGNTVVNG